MPNQIVHIFEDLSWDVWMHPEKPDFETKYQFEATLTKDQISDIIRWDKTYIEKLMAKHKEPELDL